MTDNITPSPPQSKKRKFHLTETKETGSKRRKTEQFKYNTLVPSLQVVDLTQALKSFHLYQDEKHEEKKIVHTHSDFIERFNPSIAHLDQDLYLFKYRYVSVLTAPNSFWFYYKTLEIGTEHFIPAWKTCMEEMSIHVPTTQEIIDTLQPITKRIEMTGDPKFLIIVHFIFIMSQVNFERYLSLHPEAILSLENKIPLENWNNEWPGVAQLIYVWALQNKWEHFWTPIEKLIKSWNQVAVKFKSCAWVQIFYRILEQSYPQNHSCRFYDVESVKDIENLIVKNLFPFLSDYLPLDVVEYFATLDQFMTQFNALVPFLVTGESHMNSILNIIKLDTHHSPFHPYSTMWVTRPQSHFGAGFAIVSIDGNTQKCTIVQNFLYANRYQEFEDARIMKDVSQPGTFYISNDCKDENVCLGIIHVDHNSKQNTWSLKMDQKMTVINAQECKPLQSWGIGRNWSMFWFQNNVWFSHHFYPHTVISVATSCQVIELSRLSKSPFFEFDKQNYRFSLGTPAIVYNQDEYLAVGHSRFNIDEKRGFSPSLNHVEFQKFDKEKQRAFAESIDHRLYYYFMFFYTFSRRSLQLVRMSYSFIIAPNEPFWLQFPTGIEKMSKNTFVVSYGEGDCRCKLMFIQTKDIESLLLPISNVLTDSKNYRFLRLV